MPRQHLRLLSLDGGGIRGLSTLQILKTLLEGVGRELGLEEPPKPCDIFDMIGGTSTGGIIAIMLGRLEMSVDECIEAYVSLSDKVFRRQHWLGVKVTGKIQGQFDSKALENSIKELLNERKLASNALLSSQGKCKVFVCATSCTTSQTALLTSYQTERTSLDRLKHIQIWQAARATSAASTFFEPLQVTLGPYTESYTDGATGANNPVYELWNEAQDAFLQPGERLETQLACLISVGTGVPAVNAFGESLKSLGNTLVEIATETEKTAERFKREHSDLDESFRYCRFNVANGLQAIGLEEAIKKNDIINITNHHLQTQDVLKLLRSCARAVVNPQDQRRDLIYRPNQGVMSLGMSLHDLVEKISSYDHGLQLRKRTFHIMPGTTTWILTNKMFREWQEQAESSTLFCVGIVGSGKTLIASRVIEHLSQNQTSMSSPVVFYFLDTLAHAEISANALLRSLIKQLAVHITHQRTTLPLEVSNTLRQVFAPQVSPHIVELFELLCQLLLVCGRATIVIDGINDLPESELLDLAGIFQRVNERLSSCVLLKYAIFFREFVGRSIDLDQVFPNIVRMKLTLELLQDDLVLYVEQSVADRNRSTQLTTNSGLLQEMITILKRNGEKMFLWLELQIRTIWYNCMSDFEILQALHNLPDGISETYERCIIRAMRNKKTRKYVARILYSVAYAVRPLDLQEVRTAISILEMQHEWDISKRVSGSLLELTANLVEEDDFKDDRKAKFVHHSVLQYLETQFRPALYLTGTMAQTLRPEVVQSFQDEGLDFWWAVCCRYLMFKDFGLQLTPISQCRTGIDREGFFQSIRSQISDTGSRLVLPVLRWMPKAQQQTDQIILTWAQRSPRHGAAIFETIDRYHFLDYVRSHWPTHWEQRRYVKKHSLVDAVNEGDTQDPATPTRGDWTDFLLIVGNMNTIFQLQPWTHPDMNYTQYWHGLVSFSVQQDLPSLLEAAKSILGASSFMPIIRSKLAESDMYPAHLAAYLGHGRVLRWLKDCDHDLLQYIDSSGNTSLHWAVVSGDAECISLTEGSDAMRNIAQPNHNNETPLLLAARRGNVSWISKFFTLPSYLARHGYHPVPQQTFDLVLRALKETLISGTEWSNEDAHYSTVRSLLTWIATACVSQENFTVKFSEVMDLALSRGNKAFFAALQEQLYVQTKDSDPLRAATLPYLFRLCQPWKYDHPNQQRLNDLEIILQVFPVGKIWHLVDDQGKSLMHSAWDHLESSTYAKEILEALARRFQKYFYSSDDASLQLPKILNLRSLEVLPVSTLETLVEYGALSLATQDSESQLPLLSYLIRLKTTTADKLLEKVCSLGWWLPLSCINEAMDGADGDPELDAQLKIRAPILRSLKKISTHAADVISKNPALRSSYTNLSKDSPFMMALQADRFYVFKMLLEFVIDALFNKGKKLRSTGPPRKIYPLVSFYKPVESKQKRRCGWDDTEDDNRHIPHLFHLLARVSQVMPSWWSAYIDEQEKSAADQHLRLHTQNTCSSIHSWMAEEELINRFANSEKTKDDLVKLLSSRDELDKANKAAAEYPHSATNKRVKMVLEEVTNAMEELYKVLVQVSFLNNRREEMFEILERHYKVVNEMSEAAQQAKLRLQPFGARKSTFEDH